MLIVFVFAMAASACVRQATAQELSPLTSVKAIRDVHADNLFDALPLDLECIVTCYEPDWAILFIHDGTNGMYAGGVKDLPLKFGDRIRIRGLLGSNRIPINATYELSENSVDLPDYYPVDFDRLQQGFEDSQPVRIQGQLIAIDNDHQQLTLEMRTAEGGRFRGLVSSKAISRQALREMLGKRLQLKGIVGSRFDQAGRWSGFQIWLGDPQNIEVLEDPDIPFVMPVTPLGEMVAGKIVENRSSYFRTEGVVTYQISKDMVFVQDESSRLFVELTSAENVQLNQTYEIRGCLDTSVDPPILRTAELLPSDRTLSIPDTAVEHDIATLSKGDFGGQMVRTSGLYAGPLEVNDQRGFLLSSRGRLLPVFLNHEVIEDVNSGTRIEVQGVWVQEKSLVGFSIGSCALHARKGDIQIGTQIPWLFLSVLAVVLGVAGGAFAWAVMLRKQVQKKTRQVLDATAAQRETEERYASIFINAQVMVMTTDRQGRVTAVNPAVFKQTGRNETQLLGTFATELVHHDSEESLGRLLQQAAVSDKTISCQVRMLSGDGTPIPLEVSCWATHVDSSITLHLIWHDITDRLRLEQEHSEIEQRLLSMQKMESLGVLAGGIAHDFNNLLTVVLGNVSLLSESPSIEGGDKDSVSSIQQAANRAAELTHQMLAYAGRGKFDVRVLSISKLTSEMSSLLVASVPKSCQLMFDLTSQSLPVKADATQLKQVLMNLIMNASEALAGRPGIVRIRTFTSDVIDADDVDNSVCASHCVDFSDVAQKFSGNRWMCLEVSDDGTGIDEERLAQIFDPFYTTKFSGRGLGLSTVIGVVRGHHGCLQVQSQLSVGSRFRVFLPACLEPTLDIPSPHFEAGRRNVNAHVLIVDDEPSILKLMSRSLEQVGIEVICRDRAVEAITVLKDMETPIHCLITDMTMPEMDGKELCRAAVQLRPELPIVLCSGFMVDPAGNAHAAPGVTAFLKKPFQPRELTNLVVRILAESRGAVPLARS